MQCITVEEAFRSIKGRVVLSCVAAYGLGEGLSNTHVTDALALGMVEVGTHFGPFGVLFVVYLATSCLSCIVSNQATAIILYGWSTLAPPHLALHLYFSLSICTLTLLVPSLSSPHCQPSLPPLCLVYLTSPRPSRPHHRRGP